MTKTKHNARNSSKPPAKMLDPPAAPPSKPMAHSQETAHDDSLSEVSFLPKTVPESKAQGRPPLEAVLEEHATTSAPALERDDDDAAAGENPAAEEPAPPPNWGATLRAIAADPSSHPPIHLYGIKKLEGRYMCKGVRSSRPWYQHETKDNCVWYDGAERIWSLTDKSAMNVEDPELYGYSEECAWDVTEVRCNWLTAGPDAEWVEVPTLQITRPKAGGGLGSLMSLRGDFEARGEVNEREPQDPPRACGKSSMSELFITMKDVRKRQKKLVKRMGQVELQIQKVKESHQSGRQELAKRIENLEVRQKKSEDRLESKEQMDQKEHILKLNEQVAELQKKWEVLEVLAKKPVRKKRKRNTGDQSSPPKKTRTTGKSNDTVEVLLAKGELEKATVRSLKRYLNKKKKEGVKFGNHPIRVTGTRSELFKRVKKIVALEDSRPEENQESQEY